MLKCLVERKNIPGRRQGTVLCLLLPSGMVRTGKKKETGICLLNAQLVRESNP